MNGMENTKSEIKKSMGNNGNNNGFFERKAHERRVKKELKLREKIAKERKLLQKQKKKEMEMENIAREKKELHELHQQRTAKSREKLHKLESGLGKLSKGTLKVLSKLTSK